VILVFAMCVPRRLIFRDILSMPRHYSEGEREREEREKREILRSIISRNVRRDFDALRGEEDREDAEETLIRVHSITRIKTRILVSSLSNGDPVVSSVPLSLPLSFSLWFSFFSPPSAASAFLFSRSRYRQFLSRTEGTALASIIPTSILP